MNNPITLQCGCSSVAFQILLVRRPDSRYSQTTLETLRVLRLCPAHVNNRPNFVIESVAMQWIWRQISPSRGDLN